MTAQQIKTAVVATAMLGAALGCQELNAPIYFPAARTLEVGGTDQNNQPRAEADREIVVVGFRRPSQNERETMQADSQRLGFEVPWLPRDRVHVEVLYTVKNLDAERGRFTLSVDGATEFTRYDQAAIAQAFEANGEDAVVLPLMKAGPQIVEPGQTYQGVLREDDFSEAGLDLDAMGRWMAPFAAVLINRSEVNPVGMEMVPANLVVPALYQVDFGFAADKHMTCSFLVRVRDDDDRLFHETSDRLFAPEPAVFSPMLPPNN